MLDWDSTYEIVLLLEELYPQHDLDTVSLNTLYDMVIGLPDFVDDPALGNDATLTAILREWYEERNDVWS